MDHSPQLLFLISPPRSGSTMLQRMLASHSQIHTHPEPHLLTPLHYLGYYATVDAAPYDHVNAARALREFTEELPGGELLRVWERVPRACLAEVVQQVWTRPADLRHLPECLLPPVDGPVPCSVVNVVTLMGTWRA